MNIKINNNLINYQKDNELFKSWGRDRLWLLTHEIKNLAKKFGKLDEKDITHSHLPCFF